MAGGGWQHIATSAKEIAGAAGAKTKAAAAAAATKVVATSKELGKEVAQLIVPPAEGDGSPAGDDGRHVAGPHDPAQSGEPLQTMDAYGFELELLPEQVAILERCAAKQERQRALWQQYTHGGGDLPPDLPSLKKLCRKGVPPELRLPVWLELSGAHERRQRQPPQYYANAAVQGAESPFAHQIELDVPRTFPGNAWVQSEAGQNALRHVLYASAHHNPRVGYCQSMNYLAAMLLLVLGHEEEHAFWVLACLIDDQDEGILYRDMYARDLTGTHVEMRCLRELVQHKLPRLAAHMDGLACDMSILATDWLLCLFCTSLPAETVARVWDALLNEGTKVLFRVALALLKLHEPLLLAQDNPGELLRAARRVAAEAYDRDTLMKVAFDGVGSMPMERINSYRARKQREVDREMAARETRVNLQAAVAEQGFVLSASEAALLARSQDAAAAAAAAGEGEAAAGASPPHSSSGGRRFVTSLSALTSSIGGRAKDSIDRGRIAMSKHRRGQSLGAVAADPSQSP